MTRRKCLEDREVAELHEIHLYAAALSSSPQPLVLLRIIPAGHHQHRTTGEDHLTLECGGQLVSLLEHFGGKIREVNKGYYRFHGIKFYGGADWGLLGRRLAR